MSSGVLFHGYSHYCSDGLMEALLQACLREVEQDSACRSDPVWRAFFERHLEVVYNGLYVVLPAEVIRSPEDARLFADIFERATTWLLKSDAELTPLGRVAVSENLIPLVDRLRRFASGTLAHREA